MSHRWFVSLLIVVAALALYRAGAHPLTAQAGPFPFAVGETVRFTRPDGMIHDCRIEEIQQPFVRCQRSRTVQGGDYWVNVPAMLGVEVRATR